MTNTANNLFYRDLEELFQLWACLGSFDYALDILIYVKLDALLTVLELMVCPVSGRISNLYTQVSLHTI
jgi:hypothetical protein